MTHASDTPTTERGQDLSMLRLLTTTMRPHWRLLLAAFVLLLGTAAMNAVPPYLVGRAVDLLENNRTAADPNATSTLWWLAAAYGGAALGFFGLQYAQLVCIQLAGQRALADLRSRLFEHMMRQSQEFHGR